MEDRLWRHPSEVAASQRAAEERTPVTVRTPPRQALALASAGAVGGALVVTALFLTLGSSGTVVIDAPPEPVFQAVALEPIMPIARTVPAESWPGTVAEQAAEGVAQVVVTRDGASVAGSGVVFRTDGYLLTSYDLVESADAIEVTLASSDRHEASVLGADRISGLAVLAVAVPDVAAAALALLDPPAVGDHAVTLPGLADLDALEHASISAIAVSVPISADQNLHGLIQLDVGMPDGAQGGAVIGDSGAVAGIVVDVGGDNSTYAVPIGYARKIAADIVAGGAAQHTWLGIRGLNVDHSDDDYPGVDLAVRVQSVNVDSPADRADIVKGDLIVAIDGEPIATMTDLILELRRHPPSEEVEVTVIHRGETQLRVVELSTRMVENTT